MEIRQLRYFVEICKCKSFSKAAEICFISPQGMSMSMIRLENELGRKLFNRSSVGVSLTPHAEYLLPRAKKILAIADECDSYFSDEKSEESVLPFYCSHGTIEEHIAPLLTDFRALHPEIKLLITECADLEADDILLSEECEVAVTVGPVNDNRIESVFLMQSDYILITKDDNPLASRSSISLSELKGLDLAIMKPDVRTYSNLKAATEAIGFSPKVHTFCDNILLVYYLASTKGVYGITTRHLYNRLKTPGLVAITIDDPDFKWKMYKIRRKDTQLSAPAELLWKSITPKRGR